MNVISDFPLLKKDTLHVYLLRIMNCSILCPFSCWLILFVIPIAWSRTLINPSFANSRNALKLHATAQLHRYESM